MARVRIVGRRRGRSRCAYCREAIAESRPPCEGCGALLHDACRDELGGCPTLGCAHAAPHARRGPATPAAPAAPGREQGAAAGRERRGRAGRIERERPGSAARFGPYSRLLASAAFFVVLLIALAVILVGALVNAGEVADAIAHTQNPLVVGIAALCLLGIGGFITWFSITWLRSLPAFYRRLEHLLDDGLVTPMRFRCYSTRSGKNTQRWVELTPEGGPSRTSRITGLFPPWWLSWRESQRVYVHGGRREGEPCVIEFEDGWLALLDP